LRPTLVDLFAGAGGLSLGLSAAGFESVLAVERSEMAAETYFRNMIDRSPEAWEEHRRKVVREQIAAGLAVCPTSTALKHIPEIKKRLGRRPLDLLAGGPPCQGFSLAGMREPADQRNTLPFEFLEFVDRLKPRAVLIENVIGIGLNYKKTPATAPLEQLREALELKGYLAQVLEVNSKDFGVAQQRPRIMILGLRLRDAKVISAGHAPKDLRRLRLDRWSSSCPTGKSACSDGKPGYDIGPLAPVESLMASRPTVKDAIDDLYVSSPVLSDYVLRLNEVLRPPAGSDPSGPGNLELRHHSSRTQLRFALHLALSDASVSSDVFRIGARTIPGTDTRIDGAEARGLVIEELRRASLQVPLRLRGSVIRDPTGLMDVGRDFESLAEAIVGLSSAKHSQRALVADQAAPTMLSLPDDFVHYREPRVLSVREMARVQSFPDTFTFYAKATTGGKNRKNEVPQYTQVGNAVPPWMAYRIGEKLRTLLGSEPPR
jgi:DNA (cytosine-5)-methyltransferase 1